jgi:enoyl-CoA hydratase/carnithine racemase
VREIIGPLLARDARALLEFTTSTCDLIRAIRALPRPVIASVNGTAAGAGAVIALASDVRVAAETARIAFLFVKVGLSGADMGAAHLLPRVVGLGRATELLMTGEFIDAAEAHRIGLYNRVVPPGELTRVTAEMADRLARGPRAGLAATKEALAREMHMDLHEALLHEARVQAELMQGPDFREGFTAFQERRPPRFPGTPE